MRNWCRVLWLFATCSVFDCHAGIVDEREAQLKAAYVFNFLKFVEWNSSVPGDLLQVCFAGADDVREALGKAATGKTVSARRVLVRPIAEIQNAQGCAVIFVDAARGTSRWSSTNPALTIGETQDFTQTGGIIRLYTESNRLRFSVNVGNARRAGVQISSNLLKLATEIEQEATL
jgi:YfiR/HmsC-like